MEFAEKLIALRKSRELTQEQLAEQINVSRQSISKWESGQVIPEVETGIKKYLRKIFFYLSEIFFYLSEKIIYPTVFLFLSNQLSNFPKTKRCTHEYNDNANQPVKPITVTDHENQEQHQEKNQKLKDTESETKSG